MPYIPQPSSGGGGGGGGGGGAPSGESYCSKNIWELREGFLQVNSSTSYKFNTPDLGVYEVLVTPAKSYGVAEVKVFKCLSEVNGVEAPQETVYFYGDIWVSAKELSSVENLKDATIRFKVENKWLSNNKIEENNIRLFRLEENTWILVETERLKRDEKYVYYQAKTNAFEPFSITTLSTQSTPVFDFYPPIKINDTEHADSPGIVIDSKSSPGGDIFTALIVFGILIYTLKFTRKKIEK